MMLAGTLAGLLVQGHVDQLQPAGAFPYVFWVSSLLLAAGSVLLHLAVRAVRRERQRRLRGLLIAALGVGTLFVALQSYGLWQLVSGVAFDAASRDVVVFVAVFVTLHAIHFMVAIGFLIYVVFRTFDDRYDHEYHWGIVVCGFFWHALGIVWLAILAVVSIAL